MGKWGADDTHGCNDKDRGQRQAMQTLLFLAQLQGQGSFIEIVPTLVPPAVTGPVEHTGLGLWSKVGRGLPSASPSGPYRVRHLPPMFSNPISFNETKISILHGQPLREGGREERGGRGLLGSGAGEGLLDQ